MPIEKQYSKILSTARLRESEVSGRTIVTESESDRGRVLFSPAFRRLQQKAQVFSMEPNAAVRSRLTHSLEVSQLGRFIGDEICAHLKGRLEPDQMVSYVNFIETACLFHDIGNPPFGHFGEAAIQKWFRDNGKNCILKATSHAKVEGVENYLADFYEFDGNPQGFRVVTRLQWNSDEYGLNLTKTTLASFLKYIRCAGEKENRLFTSKAGYFSTERAIVESVMEEFGFTTPQRFPLAYVMEAADDIAYCISDLEDSVEKGLVEKSTAITEIEKYFVSNSPTEPDPIKQKITEALEAVKIGQRSDGKRFTYTDFRTTLNRTLVTYAADKYIESEAEIFSGTLDSLLPRSESPGAILEALKQYCRNHVYCHPTVQLTELAGYTAIRGLLDLYKPLLTMSRANFARALENHKKDTLGMSIVIESKLLSLYPKNYIKVYQHHLNSIADKGDSDYLEWNARAHLIVDFVSGMTDDYAMTTYQSLSGMRL